MDFTAFLADILCDFLIEGCLQFVNGVLEAGFTAKLFDELQGRSHFVERRYFKNVDIIQSSHYAFILIFCQ